MNTSELISALDRLQISRSEIAGLLGVTARGVGLWLAGERDVPGPVEAYLRLLCSLPSPLIAQEIARAKGKDYRMYEGVYSFSTAAANGQGSGVLVLMNGVLFGTDGSTATVGVRYDGAYDVCPDDPSQLKLHLVLTVPPGVELITGVPPQPMEYTFKVEIDIPIRGSSVTQVATPFGPVDCTVTFTRDLPDKLAA